MKNKSSYFLYIKHNPTIANNYHSQIRNSYIHHFHRKDETVGRISSLRIQTRCARVHFKLQY